MVAQMREQKEMKKVTYFHCYNPRLRKFLGFDGGLRWAYRGFNERTQRRYWAFEENERLSELIEEYKKQK